MKMIFHTITVYIFVGQFYAIRKYNNEDSNH